jgi:rhodanese-related sulfurtransferase
MKTITASDWKSKESAEAILLDVRSPGEFSGMRAEGAVNLPLDKLTAEAVKNLSNGKSVILLCQGGTRARMAAEKCEGLDCELMVFEGGTQAWKEAGLPVVESKGGVISLERQVRIGAGSLVVLGVILAEYFGLSGLQYLSLFVGLGLVFAGVTDTCGMGILLAKMPWNQKASACCGSSS